MSYLYEEDNGTEGLPFQLVFPALTILEKPRFLSEIL
jgi:hypothetical protein